MLLCNKFDAVNLISTIKVNMPQKLPNNFVNERYCKDEKYIVVYDSYTPNYKSISKNA